MTIAGNDHFSSLPKACMNAGPELDYGFIGSEIVGPFAHFIAALRHGTAINPAGFPSLVHRSDGGVRIAPPYRGPVFAGYEYALSDRAFPAHLPLHRVLRETDRIAQPGTERTEGHRRRRRRDRPRLREVRR